MINLTVVIDNDEAIRRLQELQTVARRTTTNVVTDSDRMDAAFNKLKQTLLQLGAGVSLQYLVRQVAQVRGEFQQLEVAFETMLGSKQKADALMAQLTKTAAITPFGLQDVAGGAKQLLAYGIASEEVNETLVRLGDIAAGLSIPLGDLVYLYGTTMTQGRVFTQDLRQFMGRGIPVAEELAKQFGVSKDQVGALVTAGKVGFPEIKKAIVAMTSEGGKFGGLMEKQSKTITGLISNLGDAMDVMYNEIGQKNEGIIAGSIQSVIKLVENYQKVLDVLIPIITAYGAYKAALISVAAAKKAMIAVDSAKSFLSMARSIGVANAAMKAFNITCLANPWALLFALVTSAGVAIYRYSQNTKSAEKATAELHESLNGEVATLDSYFDALKNVEKGTEAYKDVIVEINSKYGSYFENQLTEKSNAEEIAAAYDRVKNSIIGASMERAKAAYLEEPTEDLAKSENKMLKRLQDNGAVMGLNDLSRGVWARSVGELLSKIKSDGGGMSAEEVKNELADILRTARELSGLSFSEENEKYYKIGLGAVPIERFLEDAQAMAQADAAFKEFSKGYIGEETKVVEEPKGASDAELKEIEKRKNKIAKLTSEVVAQRAQAEVDAMEEGTAKVLAQIQLDYDKREAEILKQENELRALQKGKLTPEQEAEFGVLRSASAYQAKSDRMQALYTPMPEVDIAAMWDAEQKAMNDYLAEFGTYQEQLQAMVAQFDSEIEGAATEGERAAIEAERDAALAEIEVRSSEFAEKLVNLSLAKLGELSTMLEAELASAEMAYSNLESSDSDEAKNLRAKINTLMAQIKLLQSQLKVKDKEGKAKDAQDTEKFKNWAELQGVLTDLGQGFNELGDEIGGTVGEIISSAGNIASSTASMIGSIGQLAQMTTDAAKGTAEGASQAIQQAERASVILAIIQAAIQIIQQIANIAGLGADYEGYEELKAKYEALNEVWDQLLEKKEEYIKMSYGEETRKVGEEAIDIIEKQIDAYRQLGIARLNAGSGAFSSSIGKRILKNMDQEGWNQLRTASQNLGFSYDKVREGRMEGLFSLDVEQLETLREQAPMFWAQLDEDVRGYLDSIIEGQERIDDLHAQIKEQLTQVSFDSVFDSFIDTLMDMDASAEEFADQFSEYMMRAILSTQIGEAYKDRLQQWYDQFAAANDDSDITSEEIDRLRSEWDAMVEEALALRDGIAEITGYGQDIEQQQATVGGFEAMDQETGSELNGRFTDIQGKFSEQLGLSRQALDGIAYIGALSLQQLHTQQDTRDILIQMAGNVAEIRTFAETLPQISLAVDKTNRILDERL